MEWPSSDDVTRTLLLRDYNTRIVAIGTTTLGVAGGIVGVFMLLRRRSLLGDVISHSTLPGIAIAFLVMEMIESGEGKWLPGLLIGSVIVESIVKTAVPGAGRYRFVATRDSAGSYAMVYAPCGRKFSVRMDKVTGSQVKAWWFDPRTGAATLIGEFANKGAREFRPPNPGDDLDWVLVLDDAAKDFPPPGTKE